MNTQSKEFERQLQRAKSLINCGDSIEEVLQNSIPKEYRDAVEDALKKEKNLDVDPVRVIGADNSAIHWTQTIDRSKWHYWETLRKFIEDVKKWKSLASIEDASEKILRKLPHPSQEKFDVRGLVLGHVQSGKTANYTAVIAKAADVGYRFVVVLTGMDKILRKQTNSRLKRELVGYFDDRINAVRMPPTGKRWHEFTRDTIEGDFNPGQCSHAALQGSQPVLLVVKKNGPVLRKLLRWLDAAPLDDRKTLAMLVIDDEADQASVDTRGTYQTENNLLNDQEYEPPAIINGLIRDLLQKFERRVYIAYTATPYANILIPHDTIDPTVGNDLFPKDFIVTLPKTEGYFGTEEIFGRLDLSRGDNSQGFGTLSVVPENDIGSLELGQIPISLSNAIIDFILAGAARAQRGDGHKPATMLIHTSHSIQVQSHLKNIVAAYFGDLKSEWRYHRRHSLRDKLTLRWESEFRGSIRNCHLEKDVGFEKIEPFFDLFLDAIQIREVNSGETGEELDYEKEPNLKTIVIGGNQLSRGLTLEGLLVSFFIRRSTNYDTLMQMGRWFGFRDGYEDLTRICMTAELQSWFIDLAMVEYRLRKDIEIYDELDLKPYEVGIRIWQHSTMQATSALKRRFSESTVISQDFSLNLAQTTKFPLSNLSILKQQAVKNTELVIKYIPLFGVVNEKLTDQKGPVWKDVEAQTVLGFLSEYSGDNSGISFPLVCEYINRAVREGELINWTVAIRGLMEVDEKLGSVDWGINGKEIAQVYRSRLSDSDSIGTIIDPPDEGIGLETENRGLNARSQRPPEQGLLLIYPISRHSGYDLPDRGNRRPIFKNSNSDEAFDLVGLCISFPKARTPHRLEAYLVGSAGWRVET